MCLGKSLALFPYFITIPRFELTKIDRCFCEGRHLSHICFEVLKNALRAVVEKHGPGAESFPPIKMLIAEGEEVVPKGTMLTKRI